MMMMLRRVNALARPWTAAAAASAAAAAVGAGAQGRMQMMLLRRGMSGSREQAGPKRIALVGMGGASGLCAEILREARHQVDEFSADELPTDRLKEVIGEYEGLVVRSSTDVTEEVLAHAHNMRIIGRAGVGVDNIDVAAATRQGIMVLNTPGGNTASTAQLAVTLLCTAARKLAAAHASVKAGKWERKAYAGTELAGKTLGIVGCGRVGLTVAEYARSMGMHVLGFDPVLSPDVAAEYRVNMVDLEDIWKHSHFITLHTPLTPDTKHIVNSESIAKCKKGVTIINCARGGIANEADLLAGLESGHIASVALDVYETEPPTEGSDSWALAQHPNTVCSPHLGASTAEAQSNVARSIALQIRDVLDGKAFRGVVNCDYLALSVNPHMEPFMRLGNKLGQIACQLTEDPVRAVKIKTWGGRHVDVTTDQARKLLLSSMLAGVMRHTLPERGTDVDLLSAPLLASEHGIEYTLSTDFPPNIGSPYWNLITAEVETATGELISISGSVFGREPHVVQLNRFRDLFAMSVDGSVLCFQATDEPGVLGHVLEVLAKANVNVASLSVGRQEDGQVISFISVDGDLSPATRAAVRDLDTVHHVRTMNIVG